MQHLRRPLERWLICRRRTWHRVSSSLSVKKNSPMSACRRSMSSTRKTAEHPNSVNNLPVVAAAAEAAAAEAAEAAVEAAAEAAGAAAAAAGACRPEVAGSARTFFDCVDRRITAGFDHVRSGQCLVCSLPTKICWQVAHDGRAGGQLDRETPACRLDGGALATRGIPASQWRSALVAISVEARMLAA